ncbi:MAG: peptidoglycan editing factor PgeF [Nitrospirales bacterium]|nr:peptidoglycan editing factor PgeF [Nitrospirales bacterium]
MQMIETPPIFHGLPVKGLFTMRTPDISDDGLLIASRMLGAPLPSLYLPVQQHTDRVVIVENDLNPLVADAVITARRDIVVGVRVADCVPLLLFDSRRGVVGAVHAGWRGTAAGILRKTIQAMMDRFLSSPDDILVAIGPAIRGCCYGVGDEVAEAVEQGTGKGAYLMMKGEQRCLDLPSANSQQAISAGVPKGNIWVSGDCTFCRPDKYYSYRFSKGVTGRQYGLIGMIP